MQVRPVPLQSGSWLAYGFWIFLLSDIVMFAALFAAYAVLAHATAGGPSGAQLFNQRSVAIETGCLLASSYTCGLMSLAIGSRRYAATYLAALITFVLGAAFLALEVREFAGMIADRGRSATQRFPLCLLYPCRLSRAACHRRPGLAGGDDGSGRSQGLSRDASSGVCSAFRCSGMRSTSSGYGCSRWSI